MKEKIKNFDKKREQYEDYNIVITKFIRYLIEIIWAPMLMIPVQEFGKDWKILFFCGWPLSFTAIAIFLSNYMNILQGGRETVSIYTVLKYTPVDMREVFYVRLGYLYHYCKKKLLLYLLFQVTASLIIVKTLSIWNILLPIFWVGIASFLPGFMIIIKGIFMDLWKFDIERP